MRSFESIVLLLHALEALSDRDARWAGTDNSAHFVHAFDSLIFVLIILAISVSLSLGSRDFLQ